jgi:bifunctional non-homologous end joining protein LigD
MSLTKYQEKRHFDSTPEPRGTRRRGKGPLRFVVQKHWASRLHYDFRLELDSTLKSWAVPKGPSLDPDDKRLAVMVEDHPLEYARFEGIIPEGNYGAGTVMVWDEGNYCSRQTADRKESERLLLEGLQKGHLTFVLYGQKLKGEFALIKLKRGGANEWLLVKKRDQWASDKDVTGQDISAASGRTREEIAATGKVWRSSRPSRKGSSSNKVIIKSPPQAADLPDPPLTNLTKVFWPAEGYTKGDLLNYYREVAEVMVPYLRDRPESLNRHPNGINGKSFFQKDVSNQPPPDWVTTVRVPPGKAHKEINYILCQDRATLLYIANLGCIEINPWNSRVQALEQPDYIVIDLDPNEAPYPNVIEAAQAVHKLLDRAGVESLCKTSGKRGLHIYVPLGARYNYDLALQFADLISRLVNLQLPATTSLIRSPAQRRGKVYLDVHQNHRSQTVAAVYCARPYPGATVSTPLKWQEVHKGFDPAKFTIRTMPKRLDKVGDLWKPMLGPGVDLAACLERLIKAEKNG